MQVLLETRRLVLRRFSVDDADNLVNLDAGPDVMRFVSGGMPDRWIFSGNQTRRLVPRREPAELA